MGDPQERWTGSEGKLQLTVALETSGQQSFWRTAGPARKDKLARGIPRDGRRLREIAGTMYDSNLFPFPAPSVSR